MTRFLHVMAILALIGSALYAYRIKYDTIYLGEQVAKRRNQVVRERDAIAVLRAEWQLANRPDRIQTLSDKYADLQPGSISQIVKWSDIPMRPKPIDSIGQKLEALGLAEPTNTPSALGASGDARTPTSRKP